VCDNTLRASPPATSTPQLVQPVLKTDTIVAANSTGLDVNTVSVSPATAPAICPPNVSYSNQFLDFGIGAITARQLLVAPNGSQVAVLPTGINQVLTAVPGTTPSVHNVTLPAGATEALAGDMTRDGNTLWVGAKGTHSVVKIDLPTAAVVLQVPFNVTQFDGTPAQPNIVVVAPK
jgi:hypothetical protein